MLADVLTHERRGTDVAVFTCRPREPLTFRAGQHVSIEWPAFVPHKFAIANAPRPDGVLEFHVRARNRYRDLACALVRRLQPGDVLGLGAPTGTTMIDPFSRRDLVFVTGGTGLARAKALIDEVTRYNRTRWIHLFRGERRRADFYDRSGIDQLAERHPWLTVVRATSEEPDESGRRAAISEVVSAYGPWPDHDFYVFGSRAMVDATLCHLDRMRVPPDRVQRTRE